jgi:hypothetical protein
VELQLVPQKSLLHGGNLVQWAENLKETRNTGILAPLKHSIRNLVLSMKKTIPLFAVPSVFAITNGNMNQRQQHQPQIAFAAR